MRRPFCHAAPAYCWYLEGFDKNVLIVLPSCDQQFHATCSFLRWAHSAQLLHTKNLVSGYLVVKVLRCVFRVARSLTTAVQKAADKLPLSGPYGQTVGVVEWYFQPV